MSSAKETAPGVIFGTAPFGNVPDNPNAKFRTIDVARPIFDFLKSKGLTHLDSARAYPPGSVGRTEAFLGEHGVAEWATIDTKVQSYYEGEQGADGALTAERVSRSIDDSLRALRVPKVHTMYLHVPDRKTPLAETLHAVDKEFRAGKFERFGISNYRADEVAEIIAICERDGLSIRPAVYQGQYNALWRGGEKELFPLLRKHGIAFYAYGPSAGGIFHVNPNEATNVSGSRWDKNTGMGAIYREMYFKENVLEAASKVQQAAIAQGLDGHSVALRWTIYHSVLKKEHGDKVVLGVSNLKQLESNVAAAEAGPLPDNLVQLINDFWPTVAQENSVYYL